MAWEWADNIDELTGEPMSSSGPHVNWEYILSHITGTGNSTIGTDTGSAYLPTGGSGIYKCTGDEVTITTTYNLYISNSISSPTAHYRLGTSSNTGRYVNASWRPNSGSVNYISFRFAINDETEEAVVIYLCSSTTSLVVAYEKCAQAWARKELYTTLTAHINTGATVRVNYYLPDYDYTYAKITYKKDSEPASETDGTSVNILKDQSSVNIEGLEEEKTYYFKIFTDKSESEAFPFLVPELIDYGNMIFNDNSEITVVNNNSSTTAITTPKFLVDTYKEKSTQSGYSYMNANANTWLIGPANKTTGYYHIFGWTLPTDKDIYIICQNDTGQNAYYVWIWWDGLTSRDMLGTNCGYSKWFVVSNSVIYYESGTALNNYSSFNNNLIVDNNRYWSQTGLGGDSSLKPIVWTEVNTSRIWVNGKKLT